MKIIKTLFRFLLFLLLTLLLVGLGYYIAVTKEVKLSPEKLVFNERTITLYDNEGTPCRHLLDGRLKQNTPAKDIPKLVKQAFIDTEDRRFYRHNGYDIKRIAAATLHNAKAKRFKEGASTISQQLIKNTHLSQEKTIKRKLREWKLTRALEARYSKEEILERYLNSIYFGHGSFGITSAASFYFGKAPNELSLGEAALLAGLVQSPNRYSPFKSPEACARRKAVVLAVMEKNGSIDEHMRKQALLESLPSASSNRSGGYATFVFDELSTLAEKYSFKIGGRIELYTYLDQGVQQKTQELADGYESSDKSLLVLDRSTHGFKACVSTLGNRPRLPGSLIKPLLVYAPAVEEDILSPATPILDEKINYGGYSPENYDGKYHGYISARECVEKSLNIPAVKTLECLTLPKATAYLEKLGLPVDNADKSLALALGGMKEGYPLKDIVAAYAAFANQGVYEPCGFLSQIKINGVTVYKKPTTATQVFSEATAYLTSDMLKSTVERGTAKKLRSLPFNVAAKTGTVGTKKGNTDAYALSYTTRDVAAVWLGNADNGEITATGGGLPCDLLYALNEGLHERYQAVGQRIEPFSVCTQVQKVALDKATYYDTHTLSLADELSPPSSQFFELFKSSAIPLNKSTSYSNPHILAPRLILENNRVSICFDEGCPDYYRYKIDRYDYATHTTVYEGKYLPLFIDDGLLKNKNYVYTVTPFYEGRAGVPVTLPTVTTKGKEFPDDWWQD